MSDFFSGFEIPNTTPVPDIVFDELLEKLTGNELKVLLYIIRRTYGFGKNADAISLSQFREGITTHEGKILDKGCGIRHNRTILVALTSLEENGCVASKKRQTKAGDQDTTVYGLRFKKANKPASSEPSEEGVVTSSNHVVTSSNEGGYSTSPRWLPQVTTVVTSSNQQETVLQYTELQETDKQEESITDDPQNTTTSPNGALLSQEKLLQEQLAKRDEQIALLLEQVTQLSTKVEELSTRSTQDNQAGIQANEQTGEASKQPSYSHPATENMPPSEPAQPANNKSTGRRTKKDASQDLTLQGSHVIEMYEAFKKRKITRNPDNVKAANGLGESVASDSDFNEVLTVIANDKYLKDHNVRVDLDFVYRKYDGFFDVVVRLREKASSKSSQSNTPAITQVTDPYVLATMRSAQRTLAAVN